MSSDKLNEFKKKTYDDVKSEGIFFEIYSQG